MHLNCCMVKPLPSIKMTVITIQNFSSFFLCVNIKANWGTHIELYAFLCWLYRCAWAIWCVSHTICPCVKCRTWNKNTRGKMNIETNDIWRYRYNATAKKKQPAAACKWQIETSLCLSDTENEWISKSFHRSCGYTDAHQATIHMQ